MPPGMAAFPVMYVVKSGGGGMAGTAIQREYTGLMRLRRWVRAWLRTYSTRLAIGLFLLVVATTLSAGVPAYWLTHVQLTQQVATHLRDAQQSTLSLLLIEQRRLANVALLFAQRPTLANLLAEENEPPLDGERVDALNAYLADFQAQIDLDLLLICASDGAQASLMAGSLAVLSCPAHEGFLWVDGRPALVARRPLVAEGTTDVRGLVVTGMWLDAAFLNQLAAGTGVEQTLVGAGGNRLVSSLEEAAWLTLRGEFPQGSAAQRMTPTVLQTGGHYYYRLIAPLVNSDDSVNFYSEILLAADELIATRNRVLGILLTSTGVVALLGVALGVWSIRRITSPLASLTAQAERISQGEFETPIPHFGGPVEVQTLTAALQRSQTSIVQALEDRATARDRLDNLVQSLVEGVVILDRAGKITFWNQGAALITGWPAEQAHGKLLDHVLPTVESHHPTILQTLPAPGQRRRLSVLTSGGKASTLEVTSVRNEGAQGMGVVAGGDERALVLRDVTEEEAMQHLRSYFLANISHEFRTPLSTLNASMELLMDEGQEGSAEMSGSEMRGLLKPIHLSLLELQTLIDNLLEGSTIEAGEFRLRKREMTLNEAITGALTVMQPMLERRRQTISVTEPATLGHLWADRVRLTQVLVNLLANASKYTPMGEAIDVTVTVKTAVNVAGPRVPSSGAMQDIYRVMVADRGPGIPEAERVNLFRRFVRLEHSQSAQAGEKAGDGARENRREVRGDVHGTGIGLYVVKTTVEAHDGRVGIEDRPGGGSIFWFEIPRGEMPQ